MDEDETLLQSARDAIVGHVWQEAFESLVALDARQVLAPEDLEAMSEAAFWSGHTAAAVDARQRAYAAYVEAGRLSEAASAGLVAGRLHFMRGDTSVASGWLSRVQRLLLELPECAAHAEWAWAEGQIMMFLKDPDQALARAREAEAIADRVGDRDLVVLAISMQGYLRLHAGDVSGGMRLLDEGLAAALAGELSPFATAEIFCEMVVSCLDVADYERAAEWLEIADRAGKEVVCFPGCCRVHRSTVLRQRGEWPEAHRQAHLALSELDGREVLHEGMALTEMGELHRCKGELAPAEKAFGEAHEKGWAPQPGLARVLFAKDDLDGAGRMIQRAVEQSPGEPAALIRLLPAQVEVALAAGDTATADAAASHLAEVALVLGSSAAVGANACVAGLMMQQRGDLSGAARQLDLSVRSWQKARSPYETAQTRMRLATVLQALGDVGAANLELAAAHKTFQRLGAAPDAREAALRLGQDAAIHASCTFMFTDIVNSTTLLTSMGDDAWHRVRQWHERTVSAIVSEHQGRIVTDTGDGFFVAFDDAALAGDCAVAIQRALDDHRRANGFAPSVRIGLHAGSAISVDDGYSGQDVNIAARIGALAGPDQILVSAALADQLGTHMRILQWTETPLKGIPETVQVATLDWR